MEVILLQLKDVKTIRQLAEETGISVKTLTVRLKLKSRNMIENEDYKRLGPRQSIILSPEGIEKITK